MGRLFGILLILLTFASLATIIYYGFIEPNMRKLKNKEKLELAENQLEEKIIDKTIKEVLNDKK